MTPLAAAPVARADIDDLFTQPIADAIGQGIDVDSAAAPALAATESADPTNLLAASDPFASLDSLLTNWYQTLEQSWTSSPLGQAVDSFVNSTSGTAAATDAGSSLFGDTGTNTTAGAVAETGTVPETASVPLQVNGTTEPVVDISVSGGADIPVEVDTGSDGLVIPWYDLGLQDLGFPTGLSIGSYSGGLHYVYATLPATVDFGNGIETAQTPVDAVLFTFPTSPQDLFNPEYYSLPGFLGSADADGILGIGPNAVGPGPSSVITALPGDLSEGVLIDEPGGVLQFGPNPLGTDAISVNGAPDATLEVSIDGSTPQPVPAVIDSGGVYGTLPSSLFGGAGVGDVLKPGTEISVYTQDGEPLYSYTVNETNSPTITSGTMMNTGYFPFSDQPVYISNSPSGQGTTIFGG